MYFYTAKGTNNFLPANSHFVSILKFSQTGLVGAGASHHFDFSAEVVKPQGCPDVLT